MNKETLKEEKKENKVEIMPEVLSTMKIIKKKYNWIFKIAKDILYISENKPERAKNGEWRCKNCWGSFFDTLEGFDFISYTDEEPVNIDEFLKKYTGKTRYDK